MNTLPRIGSHILAFCLLAMVLLTAGCSNGESRSDNAVSDLSIEEVSAIAKEAYIFGLPMVMNYKTLYSYTLDESSPEYKGPFNQIVCEARLLTPDDKTVVTPNADTPYCMFWIDLRAEPQVLTVPEMEPNRFYHFQLIDLYTHNFAYVGTLSTGNGEGHFLIAGPEWEGTVPDGISDVIRSETDFAFSVVRTQLFGPEDIARVGEIQRQYNLRSLSEFQGMEPRDKEDLVDPPVWVEGSQFDERFYSYLDFMMSVLGEPAKGDEATWARLSRLGIGPGSEFGFEALSPEVQEAMAVGVEQGRAAIADFIAAYSSDPLMSGKIFGTREYLTERAKVDFSLENPALLRAAAAQVGLYGNSATEALYPIYTVDIDGNPLDASANSYRLRFEEGQLPPVKAFWSLTMYDAKTQLFVANPLDRYLLNSTMMDQLKVEDDGSLVLYIGTDPPGESPRNNWLPAPDGPFYVVLRLYGPEEPVLDGTWMPPQLVTDG